ncbi:MAG: hypothetical protein ACP5U2_18070 [Bryobacteraceae bacterium]
MGYLGLQGLDVRPVRGDQRIGAASPQRFFQVEVIELDGGAGRIGRLGVSWRFSALAEFCSKRMRK